MYGCMYADNRNLTFSYRFFSIYRCMNELTVIGIHVSRMYVYMHDYNPDMKFPCRSFQSSKDTATCLSVSDLSICSSYLSNCSRYPSICCSDLSMCSSYLSTNSSIILSSCSVYPAVICSCSVYC